MKTSNQLIPTKPAYLTEVVFQQKYQSIVNFLMYIILNI
jgi:hypothetical protein